MVTQAFFLGEKKADIFSMKKCLCNLRSIVYQVMQWTIYYINFTPLASPGVTTAVSSVPTGGEDSDFEIEYVEEEVEEELPTDDDSVAVLQHDQRQEPDTASRGKKITEYPEHPKVEEYVQPPSPQTPEEIKQEFVKGTHKASCLFEPFKCHQSSFCILYIY